MHRYIYCFLVILLLISCDANPTVESYLVSKDGDKNFSNYSFGADVIPDSESPLLQELKKTFRSVQLSYLDKTKLTDIAYALEVETCEKAINHPKYSSLGRVKKKAWSFDIRSKGNNDVIEEIVIFVKAKEKGFGLLRIQGDAINPSKFMQFLQSDTSTLLPIGSLDTVFEVL